MVARTPEAVHHHWTEAINAGDLDAVMALYEPGASLAPAPQSQPVMGDAAIRAASQGLIALKPRYELQVRNVVQADDLALLLSPWTMTGVDAEGGAVQLTGTTSDVVRRQPDGSWLFIIDNPFGTA